MFVNKTFSELETHFYERANMTSHDGVLVTSETPPEAFCAADDSCPTCPKRFGPFDGETFVCQHAVFLKEQRLLFFQLFLSKCSAVDISTTFFNPRQQEKVTCISCVKHALRVLPACDPAQTWGQNMIGMQLFCNIISGFCVAVCWTRFELLLNSSAGMASRCHHLIKMKHVTLDTCFRLANLEGGNTINYRDPWCNVKLCRGTDYKLISKMGAVDIYVLKGQGSTERSSSTAGSVR